jgi:rRNA maturation endonuclease Nob1
MRYCTIKSISIYVLNADRFGWKIKRKINMEPVIFEDDNYIQNADGILTPKFTDGKIIGIRQYFIGKKICSRCWRRVANKKEQYCDVCENEMTYSHTLNKRKTYKGYTPCISVNDNDR